MTGKRLGKNAPECVHNDGNYFFNNQRGRHIIVGVLIRQNQR